MGQWISDLSLKYKFWAVNAVAFFTTLLLVLYAIHLEQQVHAHAAKASAQQLAQTLEPKDTALPNDKRILVFSSGQSPRLPDNQGNRLSNATGWVELSGAEQIIGAAIVNRAEGQRVAVIAKAPSIYDVFLDRALS